MMPFAALHVIAAKRGEGLHPRLVELLTRSHSLSESAVAKLPGGRVVEYRKYSLDYVKEGQAAYLSRLDRELQRAIEAIPER
jgi:hypothetical protein